MMLKTLMEEKQLDFNQPLLSIRRFPAATEAPGNDDKRKTDKPSSKRTRFPAYKSELKSGPVSNPGTVPFEWENTPGRPKNESKLQTSDVEGPHVTPKLPPGRVLGIEKQDSSVTRSRTESTVSNTMSIASLDSKEVNHDGRKEVFPEKESCSSDNDDQTYVDALDTLSRTESFFMNCSVSGMSGFDDREVRSSESISEDQQARDFMISRFLPAAKACETPHVQYPTRKPIVREEQPRQVKKVESVAKSRPLDQKWQKVLPHYVQDTSRDESEDESDDSDRYENYAPRVCGLFPRFCLLNTLTGLRVEDKSVSSAIHGVHAKSIASHLRTAKEHARTGNYEKKSQSGITRIQEISKHSIDPHRRGCDRFSSSDRTQFGSTCESPVVEKTLYIDSIQNVSSEMNRRTDHKEDDDVEALRKDSSIDTNPSIHSSNEDNKHMVVVDEKPSLKQKGTVFLDSSRLVCSDKSSDDMKMKKMTYHSNKINTEKQRLTKLGYQGSNLDHDFSTKSSSKIVEHWKIELKNEVPSNKIRSNGPIQNHAQWRNLNMASDSEFGLKIQHVSKLIDQERGHVHNSNENPSNLTSLKLVGGRENHSENRLPMKRGESKTSYARTSKVPLALPSPKAPSESWLKRTLPTVSSKNMSSRSNLASSIPTPAQTPKWEIVIKSSNTHHGHLRFSEELAPIPEV